MFQFQPTLKSMLKVWGELYSIFARMAALVANAEANVCCEELCEKILSQIEERDIKVYLTCIYTCLDA